MRRFCVAIAALFVIVLYPATSWACTLIPWEYSKLAPGANALVHGKVIDTTDGDRTATLAVISYVGRGTAPQQVTVGPTEYSGAPKFSCADTSVVFKKDQEYVVLLAEGAPAFRVAYPKSATAFPVDAQGFMQMRQDLGRKDPVKAVVSSFAAGHNLPVNPGQIWPRIVVSTTAVLLLMLAGVLIWRRLAPHQSK